MREIFHRELEELGDKLVEMGHNVAEAVDHAGRALREADIELAQAVIDADNRIDELEDDIEHMSLTMLARQQPVATDLRLVVSALRLSATLERMGDLARNIASIARARYPEVASSGAMLDALTEMTHAASDITHMLLDLMENHEIALVGRIAHRDDTLDDLLDATFTVLASDEPLTRQEVVDAVLLSRFLERLGDHCVSGAKRVGYLVTGDLDASVLLRDDEPDDKHRA